MICKKPIRTSVDTPVRMYFEHPCGQCLPCLITRRQEWAGRIAIEALNYEENWFITLTYENEYLPSGGRLHKPDMQKFLKRLRKRLGAFRYFAVGEYGENGTRRPHYHAIIFGLSSVGLSSESLSSIWGRGFVDLKPFTPGRAEYVANYTTKKIASHEGRPSADHPKPFAIMSLKPAIGTWIVPRLAEKVRNSNERCISVGSQEISFDELHTVRCGGRTYPLGRTLKEKIYPLIGVTKFDRYKKMDEKYTEFVENPELYYDRLEKQQSSLKNAQRTKRKIKNRAQL